MVIKKSENWEVASATNWAFETFMRQEAPECSIDHATSFRKYLDRHLSDGLLEAYCALEGDIYIGAAVTQKASGLIVILIVDDKYDKHEIMKGLVKYILECNKRDEITAYVPAFTTPMLSKIGFENTGEEIVIDGVDLVRVVCKRNSIGEP